MRGGLNARLVGGALLLVVVVAAAFAVTLDAVSRLHDANRQLASALGEITAADRVERLVIDAETGLRGFVITREERFLEPYDNARRELPAATARLLAPEQRRIAADALARSVSGLAEQYVDGYVPRQIALVRSDPARASAVVASGAGKRRVDAIRDRFTAFEREQRTHAAELRSDSDAAADRARLVALLGLILCPLLVAVYGGYLSRLVVAPIKRVTAAAMRRADGELGARVTAGGVAEARTLTEAFNEMAASVEQGRDELEHQNAELEAQQGELERTLDELAREKERGEAFHHVVAQISEAGELEDLADTLLRELGDVLAVDASSLYALDVTDPDGPLLLCGARGFDRAQLPPRLHSGAGLAGRAVAERRALHSDHGEGGLRIPAFGGEATIRHELHLPLLGPTRAIGVLSFARVGDAPFSAAAIDLAGRLTEPSAVGLLRALTTRYVQHTAEINRTVLETAQDAYVASDQDAVVLEWSPQAEALFGYSAQQAIGRRIPDLIVPAHEREQFERIYGQLLIDAGHAAVRTHRIEVNACGDDGRALLVELSLVPLRVGTGWRINAFVRDISARVRREREREARGAVSRVLAEVEGREQLIEPTLAALGEALGWSLVAFWLPDPDGRLECAGTWRAPAADALDAFERQLRGGAAHERGMGLPGRVWASGEPSWTSAAADLPALAGDGPRLACAVPVGRGPHALGVMEFWQRESTAPDSELIDTLDAIAGLVVQVTEKRTAEAEADRLKNEFFALVSHELRTPLTSIVGYIELVLAEEAGAINDQQRRFLGIVERNGTRLQRLVGDLLFVAQVEAGTLSLEHGRARLETIVHDAVDAAGPRAEQAQVGVSAATEPVPEIRGDSDRLGQLVDNLVSNALKFTPAGGSVTVTLRNRGDAVELAVADSGIGIPQQEQARLFDRFFRASTAVEQEIPGIGLGLSICQAIAEGHGGRIQVESEVGRGTTFRVTLPLHAAIAGGPGVGAAANGAGATGAAAEGAASASATAASGNGATRA